jgi:TP901 family phage tail tape measure protein
MATTIADLVVKIGADISGFKSKVKDLEGEYSNIVSAGQKLQSAGAMMTTYVTAPLLAAGAAAITMAANVDKGIAEVVTLFGVTGSEAEAMTTRLKNGVAGVSNEVGIAQSVITEGLYNAISAGIPEENVFDFMTVAAQASIAGVTDINTAVDGITTSINAYGLSAADAERVSDSMFAAVQGGKTTFGELSGALFNIAPAAAAAGVSMEEVNAGIATLTSSGVPTSVAATQMRAALTGLQRPSEDLNTIFQSLGYESAQVAIESEGLGFALDAVKTASGGNNGELQKLLGSVEAVSAANIIAGTGAQKFATEMDRQAQAAGSTQNAFDTMSKTTSQQFQKTMTMLQNIAIGIGDKLLPPLNAFLGIIQDVFLWFNNLSEGTQDFILIIAGIAAAIGPVLIVIGKLATLMPVLAAGFTLLTGPIGLVVLAVAGIIAAAVAIYSNWEGITAWFSTMWHNVRMTFLNAAAAIVDSVAGMFSWIPGSEAMFDSLKSKIDNAIKGEELKHNATIAAGAVDNVATAGNDAAVALEDAGVAGVVASEDIGAGMAAALPAVKSMAEMIQDIFGNIGSQIAMGERVLAFTVELNNWTQIENEISVLETALTNLAKDTTISIDDQRVVDLQTKLTFARQTLDGMNNRKAFEEGLFTITDQLGQKFSSLSEKELGKLRQDIDLLGNEAKTSEDFRAIVALQTSLDDNLALVASNQVSLQAFFDMADDDLKKFEALNTFEDSLATIKSTMTGEDALQAKIALVWAAVGSGAMTLEDGTVLVEAYKDEWDATNTMMNNIRSNIGTLIATNFPSLSAAFNSSKQAVGDFKNAFTGENNKPFLENIGNGFGNLANAINSTKSFMSEFGNVSGLILSGISMAVPGLGTAIMGLSAVFEALGIDVSAALNSIGESIGRLIGIGGGGPSGPMQQAFAYLDQIRQGIQEQVSALGGNWQALVVGTTTMKDALAAASDYEDFITRLSEAIGLSVEQTRALFSQAQEIQIKNIAFQGMYDPNTGERAQVSDELRAQIMAQLAELQARGDLSAQEILEFLIAQFGSTPLKTLGIAQMLGLPALAQGGMVFGPTMALVGDNMRASSDPEVVSPLSKLNEMLVKPTLAAVSSLMGGGGGTQQVIYVTLDGRVLAESAFYNLPDVVRMHTGGLQ